MPGLTGFALHLLRDLDAVTAGLTLEWSSGGTEGAVNRIKKIKRQLYGRAGFELLRKMILLAIASAAIRQHEPGSSSRHAHGREHGGPAGRRAVPK
ncbi:hypothetical protein [Streptomyces sp. NPDC002889]|uniref:hypothetical protein n=1 Tax=Streptomyces sp. NPDC002889 TaxID=3364669 RepID=UPI0036C63468